MEDLMRLRVSWRWLVGLLLLGTALGVGATAPVNYLGPALGGLVALVLLVFYGEVILWFPIYTMVLMPISMDAAAILMWVSVGYTAIIGGLRMYRGAIGWSPFAKKLMAWWLAFLMVKLVSALFSPYLGTAMDNLAHYGLAFITFVAVYMAVSPDSVPKAVGHTIAASVLLGIILMALYFRVSGGLIWGIANKQLQALVLRQYHLPVNVLPYLLALPVAPALVMMIRSKQTIGKVQFSLAGLLIVASVLFSGARSAVLFVGAELALFIIWYGLRRSPRRAALFVVIVFVGLLFGSVLLSVSETDSTLLARQALWEVAWDKFIARPWLGWGPGTFSLGLEQFALVGALAQRAGVDANAFGGASHNIFVNSLAEIGILGMLVVSWFFWLVVRHFWQTTPQSRLAVALWIPILCMSIRGLFEVSGLFGAANGVADLMSWAWIALAIRSWEQEEVLEK